MLVGDIRVLFLLLSRHEVNNYAFPLPLNHVFLLHRMPKTIQAANSEPHPLQPDANINISSFSIVFLRSLSKVAKV